MSAAAAADDDDPVVGELDVLLSNELRARLRAQLVLLQQPLRPNWRPYETDVPGVSAQFKPVARRLELSVPLDIEGQNYAPGQGEDAPRSLQLRSSPVEDAVGSYAVGVVRGSQLVLVPVDYHLALRPSMAHLTAETGKRKEGEESEEDEPAGEEAAQAIEVTVKRRETERQQQARLKSFSYLQQEEQGEAWLPLTVCSESSGAADAIWRRLLAPGEPHSSNSSPSPGPDPQPQQPAAMPPPLSRAEYLRSFVPASFAPADAGGRLGGLAQHAAADGSGPPAGAANGLALLAAAAGSGVSQADSATPAMTSACAPIVKQLVAKHPVVSMANVRQWLAAAEAEPLARAAAQISDTALHALVLASGHVVGVRRVYVARSGSNPATEPLRKVVVELLAEKESLRKADVMAAAGAAGLAPSESQYQRVMKEVAKNNGSHWVVKSSADL